MERMTRTNTKSLIGGSSTRTTRGGTRAVAITREKTNLEEGTETIGGTETTAGIGTDEGAGLRGEEIGPRAGADRREGTKAEEETGMTALQGGKIGTGEGRGQDPAKEGSTGILREGPASLLRKNKRRGMTPSASE